MRNVLSILVENLTVKYLLRNLGLDGLMLCVSEMLLTEFFWLWIESLTGSYEYESEQPGSVQCDIIVKVQRACSLLRTLPPELVC
jgi:hypothetical protein